MKKIILILPAMCLLLATNGCSKPVSDNTLKPYRRTTGRKKGTQRPYVIERHTYYPIPSAEGYSEKGLASWYGKKFHGRKTANGEIYNMYGHTAAHKTLPMNTMLLVKNLSNGRSTVVRVNDRGPFVRNRIIDLTHTAAKELGIIEQGTGRVEIIALGEEISAPPAVKQKKTTKPGKSRKLVHQDFDKGTFYIQVGAFEYKKNARKLAEQFAARGRDVIIQQFPAAGISLYRVMVYSGVSLKQARQYEAELEQNGYPDALVIARDKR
jgi:rare lipoprotein A